MKKLSIFFSVLTIISLVFTVTVFAGKPTDGGNYRYTTTVAINGGDYDNPVTALAELDRWCGTPSATTPCLLKINPGVYDVGSGSIVMQSYVDIEGSGENTTIIRGNSREVIKGAANSAIRSLTVENIGGSIYAYGIITYYADNFKVTNVTIKVSGGSIQTYGMVNDYSDVILKDVTVNVTTTGTYCYGIWNHLGSHAIMNNVQVSVSGGQYVNGVYFGWEGNSAKMTNITVNVTGGVGVVNQGTSRKVEIEHSVISGTQGSVAGGGNHVAYSKLVGPASVSTVCIGAYNDSYVALDASCQ